MPSPQETGGNLTREQAGNLTNRPADMLARIYGYVDSADLAADLPPEAKVLDAGAGCSSLGATVARQREDVTWVNLDVRYNSDCEWAWQSPMLKRFVRKYRTEALPNLSLIGESVDRLPELFPEGHFDRGFSYYMLPHISTGISVAARDRAVRNILMATGVERKISLGPLRWVDPAVVNGDNELESRLEFSTIPALGMIEGAVTTVVPRDREVIPELASLVTAHLRD